MLLKTTIKRCSFRIINCCQNAPPLCRTYVPVCRSCCITLPDVNRMKCCLYIQAFPFIRFPCYRITVSIRTCLLSLPWKETQTKSRTRTRSAYSSVNSSNFNSSTTAWALPFTPSFNITLDIWFLTVLSDMFISFAISLVL